MSFLSSSRPFLGALLSLLLVGLLSAVAQGKTSTSPQADLEQAWQLAYQGEFNLALRRFQLVEKSVAPESPERLQALYGQAHCRITRNSGNDRVEARALYATLLKDSPADAPLRPWCELELAQLNHYFVPLEERDYATIAEGYLKVYRQHPTSLAGQEAFLSAWMLKGAALNEAPQAVINAIQDFLKTHPETPFRAQLLTMIANGYKNLGEIQKHLDILIEAWQARMAQNPSFDASTLLWQIACVAEFDLGDLQLARKFNEKFIESYPRDARVFAARQALARIEGLISTIRAGEPFPSRQSQENP